MSRDIHRQYFCSTGAYRSRKTKQRTWPVDRHVHIMRHTCYREKGKKSFMSNNRRRESAKQTALRLIRINLSELRFRGSIFYPY